MSPAMSLERRVKAHLSAAAIVHAQIQPWLLAPGVKWGGRGRSASLQSGRISNLFWPRVRTSSSAEAAAGFIFPPPRSTCVVKTAGLNPNAKSPALLQAQKNICAVFCGESMTSPKHGISAISAMWNSFVNHSHSFQKQTKPPVLFFAGNIFQFLWRPEESLLFLGGMKIKPFHCFFKNKL